MRWLKRRISATAPERSHGLTLELIGWEELYQVFKLTAEREAISAPIFVRCGFDYFYQLDMWRLSRASSRFLYPYCH
jgi:hypothetical protein